jgi:hypothetical protein
LLDSLFLGQLANKQSVVVLGYNISIKSLDDNLLFLNGMHDTVVALDETDVLTNADIAIKVLLALLVE